MVLLESVCTFSSVFQGRYTVNLCLILHVQVSEWRHGEVSFDEAGSLVISPLSEQTSPTTASAGADAANHEGDEEDEEEEEEEGKCEFVHSMAVKAHLRTQCRIWKAQFMTSAGQGSSTMALVLPTAGLDRYAGRYIISRRKPCKPLCQRHQSFLFRTTKIVGVLRSSAIADPWSCTRAYRGKCWVTSRTVLQPACRHVASDSFALWFRACYCIQRSAVWAPCLCTMSSVNCQLSELKPSGQSMNFRVFAWSVH